MGILHCIHPILQNRTKSFAEAAFDLLPQLKQQGWRVAPAPFHPDAFTVDFKGGAPSLGLTWPHLTGAVYLQELSSMLPAAVTSQRSS